MNRRRFLAALGLASLAPVETALGKEEPKVVEKTIVQDKLLEWNKDAVYYHPTLGRYVKIEEVD